MMVKGWTHFHWASIALSYLLWIGLQLYSTSQDFLAVTFGELHGVPILWFMIMLVPIAAVFADAVIMSRRALFHTPDYRIINEEWAAECERNKYLNPMTGAVAKPTKVLPDGTVLVPMSSAIENAVATVPTTEDGAPKSLDTVLESAPAPAPLISAVTNGTTEPSRSGSFAAEITWPAVGKKTETV